jgi:hypothetical protein
VFARAVAIWPGSGRRQAPMTPVAPMTSWEKFFAELDRWPAGKATFWWRDDDATIPTAALDRLLSLSDLPLALAVVPAHMRVALAERLAGSRVDVLQHGFSHENHQPRDQKQAEFGDARPLGVMREELARGWQRLAMLFGRRALRVLVPPWNRIDARLVATLGEQGYAGLSTAKPREAAGGGLFQANTHIDIIDWLKHPRQFVGIEVALDRAIDHLAARRAGTVDADEPTGLLTHHLAMDEAAFAFTAEFLTRSAAHPAVQWRAARDIFPAGRG